jgi:hypothetical protein
MKRKAFAAVVAGMLAVTAIGCQAAQNQAPEKTAPPAAAAPEVKAPAGLVTQEEAGIKIRVDMPEIKWFLDNAKQGPIVPALKQEAIPQGLAYLEEKNWLLVTSYRENGKSSLLSVIDAETGKLVKAHELYKGANLPYTGHAGGVTVSKQHVWVSSDGNAFWLKKEDLIKADNESKLTFGGSVLTDTRASFTTYSEGVLWVGEYAQGSSYPTSKTHYMNNRDNKEHKAWTVGYKLDPATDLPKPAAGKDPAVPDYILSIPDMIQGMEVGHDRIILSESYGRNNASALIVHKLPIAEPPHQTVEIGTAKVPVWFLDSKTKQQEQKAPPMSEGVVTIKGTTHVLFESGAKKYMSSSTYPLDRIQLIKLP